MRCCARCGRTTTDQATATRGHLVAYYCDDPNSLTTTCYYLAKYAGFPELSDLT